MKGLYIHIPFCNNKCPYCGFYSIDKSHDYVPVYIDALLKEVDYFKDTAFDTIYIGGGTPSSISCYELERLIDNLLCKIDYKDVEFTIEANPESVSKEFVNIIKNYPISRVSLGVQSLDDRVLKLLGRIHSSNDAIKCADMILNTGKALNMDIIYDIPDVPDILIYDTLDKFIEISPSHISAYAYDSKDTGFLEGFDEDNTLFEEVESKLGKSGYYKYETSNFAKTGFESKHNMLYWQGEEYIGIGAAAHSMIYIESGERLRYAHINNIHKYIEDPFHKVDEEIFSKKDCAIEDIIFGLRMKKGVNIEDIEKKFGKIDESLLNNIEKYINLELLEWNKPYLKTTKRGALALEYLSSSLLP